MNTSLNQEVSSLFHSREIHLLAFLGPFTDLNNRFPYFFIHLWNSYLFIFLKPENGTPSGWSLLIYATIRSTTDTSPGGIESTCQNLWKQQKHRWNAMKTTPWPVAEVKLFTKKQRDFQNIWTTYCLGSVIACYWLFWSIDNNRFLFL